MTMNNASMPVASTNASYGMWLAQLQLQQKAMHQQTAAVQELLQGMPDPESHLGQHIDIKL